MKPAGLTDPKTGRWPYAVVQLRQENLRADSYNLVGFQNHLKYSEQARVLRLIPGLENAKFIRYGQIHRNTYINATPRSSQKPSSYAPTRHSHSRPAQRSRGLHRIHSLPGLLAGRYATSPRARHPTHPRPRASANGSLTHYTSPTPNPKKFQPANITFDTLTPPRRRPPPQDPRQKRAPQDPMRPNALAAWNEWLDASVQNPVQTQPLAVPSSHSL